MAPQQPPRLSVLQPPRSGRDYPLLAGGQHVASVLVDLAIEHPAAAELPLYLRTAAGLGLPDAEGEQMRLVITDREGEAVFDTSLCEYLGVHTWGEHYGTHSWRAEDHRFLRVSLRSSDKDVFVNFDASPGVMIDPRTYSPVLPNVQAIVVHDRELPSVSVAAGDQLRLRRGYNVELTSGSPPARRHTGERLPWPVQIAAIPRSGLGQVDDCGDSDNATVRTVNRQRSDNGNLLLAGDTCFRFEPQVTFDSEDVAHIQPGVIRVYDDCEACCDCEDYLRVYFAIQRAKRIAEPIAESLAAIKQRYGALHQLAEETVACTVSKAVRLQVSRSGECQIAIIAGVYNGEIEPLLDTEILVHVDRYDDDQEQWVAADLEYVPAIATQISQGRDVGNIPLVRTAGNAMSATLNCVHPGYTGTAAYRIALFGNHRLRICAGRSGEPPERFVCREIDTTCTYLPPTTTAAP